MMNSEEIQKIFIKQMCKDFSCYEKHLLSPNNEYVVRKLIEGRRMFKDDDAIVKAITIGGKVVFSGREDILDDLKKAFIDVNGAWFSSFGYLNTVNEIIKPKGYKVEDFHHFYLPGGVEALSEDRIEEMKQQYELTWYNNDEIEQFRGDKRFYHALSFLENAPDVIALTAKVNGEIVGMSGASADCEDMWQIGIDVIGNERGLGIGPFLTILLKREILRMGKVPFYGTAESHIQSQRVAVKSGFLPAWAELNSEPLEGGKNMYFGGNI